MEDDRPDWVNKLYESLHHRIELLRHDANKDVATRSICAYFDSFPNDTPEEYEIATHSIISQIADDEWKREH